ncbi:6387_t:CDS:2 [Ambispora gerdemannii]|uniref:6387_t:CDS:1 n=1 Tax=Ambispora gerdemannii TaxID=144530 RepID=A0A9N8YNW4_9GLOM|nr:6387_t:CDS:2 [Ambispora gerdemannii]
MSAILPSQIKNKIKRDEVYNRQLQEKNRQKLALKLRRQKEEAKDPEKKKERLAQNVPKTLENTREYDETIVSGEDQEVIEDETSDEFSQYFREGVVPKLLITTSKMAAKSVYEFAEELVDVFPNSQFVKRGKQFTIKQIVEFCNNRGFTDIMVVNEDKKCSNAITLIHLPDGPTAYFKLTSIKLSKQIRGHGRSSCHKPELILNNFNTRLGHTVGRWLQALFPHVPEFQGRQVATFHNQQRVDLQELGPRFTLKLKWLQKGAFEKNARDGDKSTAILLVVRIRNFGET